MGIGPHRVRASSTPSELQELIDQPVPNGIPIDAATTEPANLRRPHHDNLLVPVSAEEIFPGGISPGGGSPV
jgi:hypothetical protein